MPVTEIMTACAGMTAGVILGRRRLMGQGAWTRKNQGILVLGLAVVFVPGCYLMTIYGYHILKMVRYWILMCALVLLAIEDMQKKIIPNRALAVLAGIRTVAFLGEGLCFPGLWLELMASSVVGLAGGGLLFLLAGLVARKGIGMGDVKLIAVMGYYLGFQVLMSDLIITLTITVAAGVGVLVLKKGSLHSEMPFAPFAAVGTIITILMGF